MGIVLGLLLGLGLLLIVTSGTEPAPPKRAASLRHAAEVKLAEAGLRGVRPEHLWVASAAAFLVVTTLIFAISKTYPLALALGGFAAVLPFRVVSQRIVARRRELRGLWPEVVDSVTSALRAGLSLPEALSALADRGPLPLRPAFSRFAQDYRVTGAFTLSLDRLRDDLADPAADRIIEALRLAREVGGSDIGRLLRTLSAFLREDARVRSELETRQGWTVNAARLALAAPWCVLLLLCVNGSTLTAYNSPTGVVILAGGLAASVVAYLAMMRIGRLPSERRLASAA